MQRTDSGRCHREQGVLLVHPPRPSAPVMPLTTLDGREHVLCSNLVATLRSAWLVRAITVKSDGAACAISARRKLVTHIVTLDNNDRSMRCFACRVAAAPRCEAASFAAPAEPSSRNYALLCAITCSGRRCGPFPCHQHPPVACQLLKQAYARSASAAVFLENVRAHAGQWQVDATINDKRGPSQVLRICACATRLFRCWTTLISSTPQRRFSSDTWSTTRGTALAAPFSSVRCLAYVSLHAMRTLAHHGCLDASDADTGAPQ